MDQTGTVNVPRQPPSWSRPGGLWAPDRGPSWVRCLVDTSGVAGGGSTWQRTPAWILARRRPLPAKLEQCPLTAHFQLNRLTESHHEPPTLRGVCPGQPPKLTTTHDHPCRAHLNGGLLVRVQSRAVSYTHLRAHETD